MDRRHAWLLLLLIPTTALAVGVDGMHQDPIAPIIFGVTGILFFAVIGRYAARRLGQPSVLGELLMGVMIGNIAYWMDIDYILILREGTAIFEMMEYTLASMSPERAAAMVFGPEDAQRVLAILQGPKGQEYVQVAHSVDVFSRYGVIFLLFLVGLETSVEELRSVGGDSLRVAIIGLLMPFLLGFATTRLLMPEASINVDLFAAATLGATSIGITARVLRDMDMVHSREAHVILGAAVMDDIFGLLMLAVVSGIIVSGSLEIGNVIWVVALASLFVFGAIRLGPHFLTLTIKLLRRLDILEAKLFISLLFVMILAWTASLVGLASIVGAFAAGVILHDGYFKHWGDYHQHRYTIKDLVAPLEAILVPIFFVLMGIQVKLEAFFSLPVIILALGLLVAAIVGKIASGLGAHGKVNRLAIGVGMMPRGEVGLIFASIGQTLGVFNDALFSAMVLMIITTTLLTPPLLKRILSSAKKAQS